MSAGLPVVDTVSVEVPAEVPLIATDDGLNPQVGSGLPPVTLLQENVTVPVYPFAGVTVIVDVDVLPVTTEAGLNAVAASV
jgi:hypothetical protein